VTHPSGRTVMPMNAGEEMKTDNPAGHRNRLRERFFRHGLDGFHDYEVVELLLTLATPRKDCKPAAKAAMKKFGTLQRVFEASVAELCEVDGLGEKNTLGIRLMKEVADRYLEKKILHRNPINNAKALFDFLYHRLRDQSRECFLVLYMDAKNRVNAVETLFEGTLTAASVYPREVVKAALQHRAAAVIFAHNHPSGDPSPSPEDIQITRQLFFACSVVGISVHEHIVIGDNTYFSFADAGKMEQIRRELSQFADGNR
jgi:DNA repair protein RadC